MIPRILALWALMTTLLCAATDLPLTLATVGQAALITGAMNVAAIVGFAFFAWLLGI